VNALQRSSGRSHPRLPGIDLVVAPPEATDLVVLAHGGVVASMAAAGSWRAPILRMWPFALAARSAAPGAAVGLMRYRYRGWNGGEAHPAADLRAVLDRLPARIQRVLLIGHSMGGRAVVAVGNHPRVAGVLGLAPWLPPEEPLVALRGTVVLAHGTLDRITDPARTTAYANSLRSTGVPVANFAVDGEKHAMLHRAADWTTLVHHFTSTALSADAPQCDALTTATRTDPLPHWNPPTPIPTALHEITTARRRLHVTDHL
jgi:predicted esterase